MSGDATASVLPLPFEELCSWKTPLNWEAGEEESEVWLQAGAQVPER